MTSWYGKELAPIEPRPTGLQRHYQLAQRYEPGAGPIHLTGIQALVRVLVERQRLDRAVGHRAAGYVSGYEGSPLAGYDLELARQSRLLAENDIIHQPGLNEELAATAVSGTQLAATVGTARFDGVNGVWYGKAPGLDRATDALRHANLVGTSPAGGAIALVGDDPAAKSSSVPCSSEYALADLAIPTLVPADPAEILAFGLHSGELSRACGLWAALKIVTAVADGSCTVYPPSWTAPDMTQLAGGLSAYRHRPSARLLGTELMNLERSQLLSRLPIATEYIRRSGLNVLINTSSASIGIVAAGKTYLDVLSALGLLGLDANRPERHGIRLLKMGAVYPLEPDVVTRFAGGLAEIIVVEDKRPFLEDALKSVLYGRAVVPMVSGKRQPDGTPLLTTVGELDPITVAAALAIRISAHLDLASVRDWQPSPSSQPRTTLTLAERRQPYFCSGCPHNSSTKTSATSNTSRLVGGGIGCHSMVLFMSPEQVGEVTGLCQMGGEGGHWIGMAPFVQEQHFVQNLGDGTFAHSGSLAIRAAVAAGVNVTFRLLRNSAVAMTGGQQAVGELPLPRLVALLRSEGVAKIVVTSQRPGEIRRTLPRYVEVADRQELTAVQERLVNVTGVSVLIHDQECAAEKRRKRRRGTAPTPSQRMFINERVCEGCGDCGQKSNCLSVQPVETEFGRKTRIDQSSCNLDYSCLAGDCPSFLTVTVPEKFAGRTDRTGMSLQSASLAAIVPEPPVTSFHDSRFTIRISGVGGTGVVTVAQILAVAALIDGRHARGLDQTGLAQKGGAVVSDLTISDSDSPGAARLIDGSADLYLGCDALVAADDTYLSAATADRTVGVISTSELPTGRMVTDHTVAFPMQSRIASAIDAACSRTVYLDSIALANGALGGEQYANMIMVGAAYQTGALPIDRTAIARAIELNGVEVQANLRAFDLGRAHVAGLFTSNNPADPAPDIDRHLPVAETLVRSNTLLAAGSTVGQLVLQRTSELVAYQSQKYARRYVEFVEQVRAAEAPISGELNLTLAVAKALFALMAYKDEYEVARLSLQPQLRAQIKAQFGPEARFVYRLHPPLLRALGAKKKISVGRWFDPLFRGLYALRRLRGTPLDLFGATTVRRTERRLISEYREAITLVCSVLSEPTLSDAISLAELPDLVRGYEHVKLANVERYDQVLQLALERFSTRASRASPGVQS